METICDADSVSVYDNNGVLSFHLGRQKDVCGHDI